MQDLAFSDARIRLSPSQELLAFGTATLTRTAAGNINFAQGASLTNQYTANVASALIRRTGFFEDLQEQFGGLGIPASAEYQGRPDTLGSMALGQPITPRTAFKIKGYQLNSFDVIYSVGTNPLTAITCQVNLTTFTPGISPGNRQSARFCGQRPPSCRGNCKRHQRSYAIAATVHNWR